MLSPTGALLIASSSLIFPVEIRIFIAAQHHYRLIVYNCGFCPGLMLASSEPEAMKSTAAMVALKAIGDPSAFLELNSTSEYIDLYRDCTSLPLGNKVVI